MSSFNWFSTDAEVHAMTYLQKMVQRNIADVISGDINVNGLRDSKRIFMNALKDHNVSWLADVDDAVAVTLEGTVTELPNAKHVYILATGDLTLDITGFRYVDTLVIASMRSVDIKRANVNKAIVVVADDIDLHDNAFCGVQVFMQRTLIPNARNAMFSKFEFAYDQVTDDAAARLGRDATYNQLGALSAAIVGLYPVWEQTGVNISENGVTRYSGSYTKYLAACVTGIAERAELFAEEQRRAAAAASAQPAPMRTVIVNHIAQPVPPQQQQSTQQSTQQPTTPQPTSSGAAGAVTPIWEEASAILADGMRQLELSKQEREQKERDAAAPETGDVAAETTSGGTQDAENFQHTEPLTPQQQPTQQQSTQQSQQNPNNSSNKSKNK